MCAVYLQFGVVGPGLFEQSAPEVSFEALKPAQGPAKNLVCRQIPESNRNRKDNYRCSKTLFWGPKTLPGTSKIRLQSQKQGRSLCVPALNLEAFALPSCDLENWGWCLLIKFCL